MAFADFSDLWLYLLAPILGGLAVAVLRRRRHRSAWPMTVKLFHDPHYPSSLGCEVPAMPPQAPARL